MGWVCKDFDCHSPSVVLEGLGIAGSKMVLYITSMVLLVCSFGWNRSLELGKDGAQWLSQNVGKH
jgi:hypothetical protein